MLSQLSRCWRAARRPLHRGEAGARGPVGPAGAPARPAAAGRASVSLTAAGAVASLPAGSAAPGARQPVVALPALTDRQLAGQRIIYSYTGLRPPARLLRRIRHGQAAGVIFFAGNIASRARIRSVAAELQRAAMSKHNPVREPLLLMTDQEGGAVRRLPGAPTRSEKQIGASAHPAREARTAGRGPAATCAASA